MEQGMSAYGKDTVAHLAGLETRVTGLEDGMGRIIATLDKITSKIDAAQKTPWGTLIGFGMLGLAILGGFGKLAYDPIRDTQDRQQKLMERITDRFAAQVVPRAEYERAWLNHDRQMDRLQQRLDRLEFPSRMMGHGSAN